MKINKYSILLYPSIASCGLSTAKIYYNCICCMLLGQVSFNYMITYKHCNFLLNKIILTISFFAVYYASIQISSSVMVWMDNCGREDSL